MTIMGSFTFLVLLAAIYLVSTENAPSLEGVLTTQDKQRLLQLFQSARLDNLETIFYVSKGLEMLGDTGKVKTQACEYVKSNAPTPSSPLDVVFYASSTASALSCGSSFKGLEKSLMKRFQSEYNMTELYYLVSSLNTMGTKVGEDSVGVAKIVELAEQEEIITSYGRAYLTASLLSEGDVTPLMDSIEDIAAQSDETSTSIYFEGGVVPTATVVAGIFELGKKAGQRPAVSALQATLFGNYILSMKYTQCVKEAYYLLLAAGALAGNQFTTPVGMSRVTKTTIDNGNKNMEVRLADALGNKVGECTVTLVGYQAQKGKEVTVKKPFAATVEGYSYNLLNELKEAGSYVVTLGSQPTGKDSTVPSLVNVKFPVTIGFTVGVLSAEIIILEKDQNIAVKTSKLQYPDVSKETFSADQHSKVKMTFTLVNKDTKAPATVHQTFIRLTSSGGGDIYFVATPTDSVYSFELDVAESAKEYFGSKSGTYEMSLIVGGASLSNPFSWRVCSLSLKFPEIVSGGMSEDDEYRYKPKPIIEHMFTPPEKRPPHAVSMAFSVAVLAPLVLLVPIWLFLGANFSKFGQSGPWAVLFHGGLAGIFMLYYCFWTNLNMFQTLQYLVVLGIVTFFAGNRMLTSIAAKR